MQHDIDRLAVAKQLVRRRWPLLFAVAALGALAGAGSSLVVSPGYVSTSQVLLQGEWDKTDLQTQVLIATNSQILDRVATATGAKSGEDLRDTITAELSGGKVIQFSASAPTPTLARDRADRATQEYLAFASQLVGSARTAREQQVQARRTALEQELDLHRKRIAQLQGQGGRGASAAKAGADLAREEADADRVEKELRDADSSDSTDQSKAALRELNVVVLEPARLPRHAAAPTMLHLTVGGGLLALLTTLVLRLMSVSRDQRLRRRPDIEAVLGAPREGSLEVAVPVSAGAGWRARARRLVRDDLPWDTPVLPSAGADGTRALRYRRMIDRMREDADDRLRLVVLLHEHDIAAQRAVAELVAAAGTSSDPAAVVCEAEDLCTQLRATAAEAGQTLWNDAARGPGEPTTLLRVVELSVTRPVIPDDVDGGRALVVLTAGTRTAWELTRLTEACEEAELEVQRVLVIQRGVPSKPESAKRQDAAGTVAGPDQTTDQDGDEADGDGPVAAAPDAVVESAADDPAPHDPAPHDPAAHRPAAHDPAAPHDKEEVPA